MWVPTDICQLKKGMILSLGSYCHTRTQTLTIIFLLYPALNQKWVHRQDNNDRKPKETSEDKDNGDIIHGFFK